MPALRNPDPALPSVHERLLIAAGQHDRMGVAMALIEGAHPNVYRTQGEFVAASALLEAITHRPSAQELCPAHDERPQGRVAQENRYRIVDALLIAGARPDMPSATHGWPVLQAAHQRQWDVVMRLLIAGANPRRRTMNRQVSLASVAVDQGAWAELDVLFERGVSPRGRLDGGRTLLHQLAQRPGDPGPDGLPLEFDPQQQQAADDLLARGVPLNGQTRDGTTALGLAVQQGNLDLVQHLHRRGAWLKSHFKSNIGLRTLRTMMTGLGLLHVAATAPMMHWLMARGLDPNARTPDGLSPLHHVAAYEEPCEDLWQALLDAGADPFVEARPGHGQMLLPSPVDLARAHGHAALVAEVERRALRAAIETPMPLTSFRARSRL